MDKQYYIRIGFCSKSSITIQCRVILFDIINIDNKYI